MTSPPSPATTGDEVLVVRTGTANTASVLAAFRRLGRQPRLTDEPEAVRGAAQVVLPGVGAYSAARAALEQPAAQGHPTLAEAVADRVRDGRPTLAICLGLQLLFDGSEESPGVAGLGLISGLARRFPDGVRVPQLGWNRVEAGAGCALLESGYAYYANSFRLDPSAPGWGVATTDHGGRFLAACERGPVLACQFHPELSGDWGMALLERWLVAAPAQEGSPC